MTRQANNNLQKQWLFSNADNRVRDAWTKAENILNMDKMNIRNVMQDRLEFARLLEIRFE